jgi:predicted histidine transporter YuiF (NhaC family)
VETIVTVAGYISALGMILGVILKAHKIYLHQAEQDNSIKSLEGRHSEDIKAIKEEQTLHTYAMLACLKGLKEQGCDGPVTEAIDKIEKHINIEAHK